MVQPCALLIGSTNSVQPYCRLAISTMQTMAQIELAASALPVPPMLPGFDHRGRCSHGSPSPFEFSLLAIKLSHILSTIYECIIETFLCSVAFRHTEAPQTRKRRPHGGWNADVQCNKIRLNRSRRSGVR